MFAKIAVFVLLASLSHQGHAASEPSYEATAYFYDIGGISEIAEKWGLFQANKDIPNDCKDVLRELAAHCAEFLSAAGELKGGFDQFVFEVVSTCPKEQDPVKIGQCIIAHWNSFVGTIRPQLENLINVFKRAQDTAQKVPKLCFGNRFLNALQ